MREVSSKVAEACSTGGKGFRAGSNKGWHLISGELRSSRLFSGERSLPYVAAICLVLAQVFGPGSLTRVDLSS